MMFAKQPVSEMIKVLDSNQRRGMNRFLVRRNPADARIFDEYGLFDTRLRSADEVVTDYCRQNFEIVIVITRNDIKFADQEMENKMPALWANQKPNRKPASSVNDEFAVIAEEEAQGARPSLPRVLEDQIFFLRELCTKTQPTVAVIVMDAEYIFPRQADPGLIANIVRLLDTIRRRDHLVCFLAQNMELLNDCLKSRENLVQTQLAPMSEGDYRLYAHKLNAYFPGLLPKAYFSGVVEFFLKNYVSPTEIVRLCERSRVTRELFLNLLKNEEGLTMGANNKIEQPFQLFPTPDINFSYVAGLEEAKSYLRDYVVNSIKYAEKFARRRIKIKGGVLLYGPPGTGKTHLVRGLAGELNCAFISIKVGDIKSKWVGESEQNLKLLFKQARCYPLCIIFIDEIDGLFSTGESEKNLLTIRQQFLTEMDGIEKNNSNLVVIGATNKPKQLGSDIIRRMNPAIYIGPPSLEARKRIFEIEMSGVPTATPIDFGNLAKELDGYTGSDIETICQRAKTLSVNEEIKANAPADVDTKHFMEAIRQSSPSLNEESFAESRAFQEQHRRSQPLPA